MKHQRNRTEKLSDWKKTSEIRSAGTGKFVFRSKNYSYSLPKKSMDGKERVGPNEEFIGDSYFFQFMPQEIIFVRNFEEPEEANINKKDENIVLSESKKQDLTEKTEGESMEKLIVDQPDQVTQNGKVEHVVVDKQSKKSKRKKLNETPSEDNETQKDVLLNDEAIDGVEIITD